jgi:DNA-damage-inducible protein D
MKKEVIVRLHASFEELVHKDEDGGEYWLARDLQELLGYAKWENFDGVVRRAMQLVENGSALGQLLESNRLISIGSGAKRRVVDYKLDRSAVELLQLLSTSFKLNGFFLARNESIILGLLSKWATAKGLNATSQFCVGKYKFDLLLGDKVLIEFDEPHHRGARQQRVDTEKRNLAEEAGYFVLRLDLSIDIVDAILMVEPFFGNAQANAILDADLVLLNARVAAKASSFANEITNFNIKRDGLNTEPSIAGEHVKNNRDVRDLLLKRGIQPESLPAAEDLKKVERRVQSEAKKLPPKPKK